MPEYAESDEKLIHKFLAGDDSAFEIILKRYLKPIYNFLYRLTGERSAIDDLTQETFLKAWKNIERVKSGQKFKTWLFTIAKNTAFDHLKRKKTVPFSRFLDAQDNNPLENISEDQILPDEILEKEDLANNLEEKLKKIPAGQRIILLMHYKEDFSLQEIAAILEKPYNTIKSQHQRGLVNLRKAFDRMR